MNAYDCKSGLARLLPSPIRSPNELVRVGWEKCGPPRHIVGLWRLRKVGVGFWLFSNSAMGLADRPFVIPGINHYSFRPGILHTYAVDALSGMPS